MKLLDKLLGRKTLKDGDNLEVSTTYTLYMNELKKQNEQKLEELGKVATATISTAHITMGYDPKILITPPGVIYPASGGAGSAGSLGVGTSGGAGGIASYPAMYGMKVEPTPTFPQPQEVTAHMSIQDEFEKVRQEKLLIKFVERLVSSNRHFSSAWTLEKEMEIMFPQYDWKSITERKTMLGEVVNLIESGYTYENLFFENREIANAFFGDTGIKLGCEHEDNCDCDGEKLFEYQFKKLKDRNERWNYLEKYFE